MGSIHKHIFYTVFFGFIIIISLSSCDSNIEEALEEIDSEQEHEESLVSPEENKNTDTSTTGAPDTNSSPIPLEFLVQDSDQDGLHDLVDPYPNLYTLWGLFTDDSELNCGYPDENLPFAGDLDDSGKVIVTVTDQNGKQGNGIVDYEKATLDSIDNCVAAHGDFAFAQGFYIYNPDIDNDGLYNGIDAKELITTEWGFIDVDETTQCVNENNEPSFDFGYIAGFKTDSGEIQIQMEFTQTGLSHNMILDPSKATLETRSNCYFSTVINYMDFDYGIYVKNPN